MLCDFKEVLLGVMAEGAGTQDSKGMGVQGKVQFRGWRDVG